jgi:methyl-accepting chemotaxis protein
MDELTQQNAALVEQATSASQAMAHEAHALYEMMGRYQLGGLVRDPASHAAGVTRVAATEPAAPAAADRTEEEPAPHSERRSSTPRSRASGSAQVAAAATDGDGEWQEF